MSQQFTFDLNLPTVDKKATLDKVKKAFRSYHTAKNMLNARAARALRDIKGPSGRTTVMAPDTDADLIRSSNVKTAGRELTRLAERLGELQERDLKMLQIMEAVESAVECLPADEKGIILNTLMMDKYARKKDSVIMDELHLCRSDYYKLKGSAVLRIAYALQIEVYLEEREIVAS